MIRKGSRAGAHCNPFSSPADQLKTRLKVASGFASGRSHLQRNTPCEDYALAYRSPSQDFGCVVLADGAGSKKRSRDGARAACYVTKAILESEKVSVLSDPNETGALILRSVRSKLEEIAVDAGEPFEQFGSTLLFAALYRQSASWYAFAGQLGDGVVILNDSSGARILFQQPKGEFVNETVFTTSRSAESQMQVNLRCESEPVGFLLTSDGVAPNLVDLKTKGISNACATIFSWAAIERQDVIKRAVQNNLENVFRDNAFDDVSLAFLSTV